MATKKDPRFRRLYRALRRAEAAGDEPGARSALAQLEALSLEVYGAPTTGPVRAPRTVFDLPIAARMWAGDAERVEGARDR